MNSQFTNSFHDRHSIARANPTTAGYSSNHVGAYETSFSSSAVSPEMSNHHQQIPLLAGSHGHAQPMVHQPEVQSYQLRQPSMQHRQTYAGVNFIPIQRHASVGTAQSDSPHMLGGDVFGGPLPAHSDSTAVTLDSSGSSHLSVGYEYGLQEVGIIFPLTALS